MGQHGTTELIKDASMALPGRATALKGVPEMHYVYSDRRIKEPFPANHETMSFGMGCFWGAERKFWQVPGVYSTAVGYQGGHTPNPTYEEVCTGQTSHNEVVLVVFNPSEVPYETLLRTFWEAHDSTQYMGQGNDIGTQYRSAIYTNGTKQFQIAEKSKAIYQKEIEARGIDATIKTEIIDKPGPFYYAEDYHQQYLAKNPGGYCNLRGIGVSCPIGKTDL